MYSDAMTQDLATCMPLDELEQDLKSMDNYKTALGPVLNKYSELQQEV